MRRTLLASALLLACGGPPPASPQAEASDGLTPAMRAAARGDLAELKLLATSGADLAARHESGMNLAHFAAQAVAGGDAVVVWLAGRHPELLNQAAHPNQHTVALEAVFHANTPVIERLLALHTPMLPIVDFRTRTVFGWTPRTFAERSGLSIAPRLPGYAGPERADWLREQDQRWQEGLTAVERATQGPGLSLIQAVRVGDAARVRQILAGGVDPNGRYGRLGATALNSVAVPGMSAEVRGKARAVQAALLVLGADPEVAETRVMRVAAGFRESVFGYPELLTPLITHQRLRGPDALQRFLDVRGPMNGYTKLIDAALRGRATCIHVLVAAGARLDLTGYNGLTALGAAERYNATSDAPLPSDVMHTLTEQ